MRIGELRHRIVLQKKVVTEDELKQQSETWTDVVTIWACVEPLSGKEYFAAKQTNAEVSVKFTLRSLNDVKPDMRVTFQDRSFEIQTVINPKERNRSLILMCTEVSV